MENYKNNIIGVLEQIIEISRKVNNKIHKMH